MLEEREEKPPTHLIMDSKAFAVKTFAKKKYNQQRVYCQFDDFYTSLNQLVKL